MAEIFTHPFSLIWQVGKSLIVNGSDIFQKIENAINAYKRGDYFEFGKNIGFALSEVFFKSTEKGAIILKRPIDEHAYDFLAGFLTSIQRVNFNGEALYNSIDGKGIMIWGPVNKTM